MPKILYVDDEPANLIVFEEIFGVAHAGADALPVITAGSGAAALAALAEDPDIAIVLSDQRMPGMTGVELLQQVRDRHPRVVRLLVTAYADLTSAIEAINRGAVHRYLRKPWQPVELRLELADALARHAQAERLREIERRMMETERVYTLGVVAAGIVHELRNPIGVVSNYIDLARDALGQVSGHGAAQARRLLDSAAVGAERMVEIVRGVELSTRRRVGVDRANVAEVAELTVGMVHGEVRSRAELVLAVPLGLWVALSPTQLSQILLNLVLNAVEAVGGAGRPGPGGATRGHIRVAAEAVGDRIRIEVSDDGPGVPADVRPRIFEAFFTTKHEGGTGLGLAICRQIATDAGGSLELQDRPGGGATFVLTVPAAARAGSVVAG
ncbi:MAG: hybrid sensor histidine kinase/response regulator [Kofleriaceae bacterium]|nr:hybrid sensor histidine kinase/response regulator [Kofleriaceae bacterium]